MRSATIRELRNHYKGLLELVDGGEEVVITKNGTPVAKLGPLDNPGGGAAGNVGWAESPEVRRDRSKATRLSAHQANEVLAASSGRW